MTKVALDRTRVYLDGRDITFLLTDLDIDPEIVKDEIYPLWRPQPIVALFNAKITGSFTSRLYEGEHYSTLEEAILSLMSRYDQVNGFTWEKRTFEEITTNAYREIVEARQVDDSGSGIAIDDDPGTDLTVLIRGDRIDYLTLDITVDNITAGDGIAITNDVNATTVYIRKADIAIGETKYTLYTTKSGATVGTIPTIAGAAEPDIGADITLTLKCTKAGDDCTLDANSGDTEAYWIAEQSNLKRHWLEVQMLDENGNTIITVTSKYLRMSLGSEAYEENKLPTFSVSFELDDYDIT